MATVFKRGKYWVARLRLWDAAAGGWSWVQRATHCEDETAAKMVAGTLEQGSTAAARGLLTRDKALGMVNDILRFAGLDEIAACPDTLAFARAMARAPGLAFKTAQKYAGAVDRFEKWAGGSRLLNAWATSEFQRYYDDLRLSLSGTTAGHHLTFWRGVFARALKLGHVAHSPAAGVLTAARDVEAKVALTRGDVAALLRVMRAKRDPRWVCLTLLGWHSGHRIADLLAAGADAFVETDGLPCLQLRPAKKRNAGGRLVVLPLPRYLWRMAARLAAAGSVFGSGSNYNGRLSEDFVAWLRASGVDPLPVRKAARLVHLKSFHSFRHAMASRLAAAGVASSVARLVTDHASEAVHRGYVHAEIQSLAAALRSVRRL